MIVNGLRNPDGMKPYYISPRDVAGRHKQSMSLLTVQLSEWAFIRRIEDHDIETIAAEGGKPSVADDVRLC